MTVRSQTDRSDYAPGFPRGSRDADEREAMGREANPPSRRPVCCPVLSERRWLCSRHEDHGGDHIASDGEDILDRWPRIPPPQPEATPPHRDGDGRSAALAKTNEPTPVAAREADRAEIAALRGALAEVDGHWAEYADGEWGPDDPEGVAIVARVHTLVTGKPTCVCGHEQDDHAERDEHDTLPPECGLCSCYEFEAVPARAALAAKETKP
jgi:hypothetical protein